MGANELKTRSMVRFSSFALIRVHSRTKSISHRCTASGRNSRTGRS